MIEEYLKDLMNRRDSLQAEADWESLRRASYLRGQVAALTRIINELELML
jgi:hypothetical protein